MLLVLYSGDKGPFICNKEAEEFLRLVKAVGGTDVRKSLCGLQCWSSVITSYVLVSPLDF